MSKSTLLQPMGLFKLYLRTLRIFFSNLHTILFLGAVLLLPGFIIYLFTFAFLGIMVEVGNLEFISIPLLILGVISLYLAISYFYAGVILVVSLNTTGQKASILQILRRMGGKTGYQILGTAVLQNLLILAGFLLLIIPGLYLFIRYTFALPIVVFERTPYDNALWRSGKLVDGSWWRIFGGFCISIIGFYIIVGLMSFTVFSLLQLFAFGDGLNFIFILIVCYSAMPLLFIYPVLLYYDMRIRKEAINIETIRESI